MEKHENDWENCEYCEQTYQCNETGYAEYDCNLTGGECVGYSSGCLRNFDYCIEHEEMITELQP